METKYKNVLKPEYEIKLEENYLKVIKFINSKRCHIDGLELSDFLQENNISYIYFEDIKDYFNYINEDGEGIFNVTAEKYVIFCESGDIFILQSYV